MNVLAELSVVWNSRADQDYVKHQLRGNPLPYFESAFRCVQRLIVKAYTSRNCTYAELLEAIRRVAPGIVAEYFELSNAVDCDVYGKWCTGKLSTKEYELFCKTVDAWKDITSRMIETLERIPT
jgi:hypothetical protein